MILTLLKVACISLITGVGAYKTPTPVSLEEHTPTQKTENNKNYRKIDQRNNLQNNQYEYSTNFIYGNNNASIDLDWHGMNATIQTNAMLSQGQYFYDWNKIRRYANSNIAPFTMQLVQNEDRLIYKGDLNIVQGNVMGNVWESTSILYNNYQYGALSTKIRPQLNTTDGVLRYTKQFKIGLQAYSSAGTNKQAQLIRRIFIGQGEDIKAIHEGFLNQQGSTTQYFEYINARSQNYETYTYVKNFTIQQNPNSFKVYSSNETTTINLNTLAKDTDYYVIEFDSIQLVDQNAYDNINDAYFKITWQYGINSDPIIATGNQGTDMLSTYINITNSTDLASSFYGIYTTTTITQEVVDIPGMMWQILTMPFTFISTAFNLTLFPGTPYAVNIANLVLTIFGILVFIFIFKLVIRK